MQVGPSPDRQPTPPPHLGVQSVSREVNRKPCTGQGWGWQAGRGQGCSSRTLRALRERRFQNLHYRQQNSHWEQAQVCCQEFRARSSGRDDPEGSGRSPRGHHVKGLRVGGQPWPGKSSGLPGGAGKDRFPSQEEGRVTRHMPSGSTAGRVWVAI